MGAVSLHAALYIWPWPHGSPMAVQIRRIRIKIRIQIKLMAMVNGHPFLDARPPLGVVARGGAVVVPGGLGCGQDPGEFLIAATAPSGVPWW